MLPRELLLIEEEKFDEPSDAWAVSYSDVLMVLLCFFVMFFSVDSDQSRQILARVIGDSNASITAETVGAKPLPGNLKSALGSEYQVHEDSRGSWVQIELPDGLFPSGEFRLSIEGQSQVRKFLESLAGMRSELELSIVGHTDSRPVAWTNGRAIEDNFDLSALRASKVIQMARAMGYDPKFLKIAASAEHGRNARSVSVVVTARSEEMRKGAVR